MKNSIFIIIAFLLSFCTKKEEVILNTSVESLEVSDITYNRVLFKGEITEIGSEITDYGAVYHLSTEPNKEIKVSLGEYAVAGDFIVRIEDLIENSEYSIKAYASDNEQLYYGQVLPFTTLDGKPRVGIGMDPKPLWYSAEIFGEILDEGASEVYESGFYFSDMSGFDIAEATAYNVNSRNHLAYNVEQLNETTTYYFKAFAKNSQGTSISEEVSFTTYECLFISLTLSELDYNLFPETKTYQNFDLRNGNTPGPNSDVLTEMIGVMLETNHSAIANQEYMVTYNYFDGEKGIDSTRVKKSFDKWEALSYYNKKALYQ